MTNHPPRQELAKRTIADLHIGTRYYFTLDAHHVMQVCGIVDGVVTYIWESTGESKMMPVDAFCEVIGHKVMKDD